VAGVLIARYGLAQAFLLNAVSFLAVIAALLALRVDGRPHPSAGTTIAEKIRGGLQYAAATPLIGFVLTLLLSVSFFVLNFNVLVPLIAKHVLRGDADAFGWLMASLGSGAIVGALTLALTVRGQPPIALPVAAGLLLSAGALTLAAAGTYAVAAATIVVQASCNTILQLTAPDALRGRIMSLYAVVFTGVTPFGALAIGWVAEHLGTPAACAAGGAGGLVSVTALTVLWRNRRTRRMR
jgi:hypothetical protein